MPSDAPDTPPAIDVDALMEDLRERISEKKAQGLYAADDLAADLSVSGEPWDSAQLERAQFASKVMPGLVTSPSESPIVGKAFERLKQQIVRANWRNLADLADQLNNFHDELTAYASSIGSEVQRLRNDVREIQAAQDGGGLAALDDRISRLSEMVSDPASITGGPDPAHLSTTPEAPGLAPLLARELTVKEGGAGVLLGCGMGELLDALGAEFIGVDDRSPLAGAGSRSGRRCLAADPVGYLETLADSSVSALLIRDLPETKPVGYNDRLLRESRRVLSSSGAVAVVVRNFAAPAERDTFWHDPWRLRPVESGTVEALLLSAGFVDPLTEWVGVDGDAAPANASCAVILARVA